MVTPAAKVAVEGTVATRVLSELRLIVRPPEGAGVDNVSVRFPVTIPLMLRFDGEKRSVTPTCTVRVAAVYPGAVAVMFAAPRLTPVTWGCVVGVVAPAGTTTLEVAVAFDGSLMVNVTVRPPAGAGAERITGNGADWPSPTVSDEIMIDGSRSPLAKKPFTSTIRSVGFDVRL